MSYVSTFSISPVRRLEWIVVSVVLLCAFIVSCANAQLSIEGGLTHEFVVQPGQTCSGQIVVTGNTGARTEIEITQTDYLFLADGRNAYGEPGTMARSNANWIKLFLPLDTLAPGESLSIPYTIDVPDDPSLVGTYWSMVMAAAVLPPSEATAEGEVGIQQVIRYGIQIVTHIGDSGERRIRIVNPRLVRKDEGPVLQIDIENTGERWVRPVAWSELYDEEGASVGRFESFQQRIFPTCSVRYRFVLSEVPSGKYEVLVVFDNGDQYVWGAQYALDLRDL